MLEKIHTKNAPDAIGPYSQAVKVNGFVFTSGQIAINPASGNVEATTIEDVIEPFLLQEGYIKRTSRGRVVTEKTYREFKINEQKTLFDFE